MRISPKGHFRDEHTEDGRDEARLEAADDACDGVHVDAADGALGMAHLPKAEQLRSFGGFLLLMECPDLEEERSA